MATGRIGVTPTLRTRWSKQPTAGTTSLSGLDDNSVALVYDVGYEAVYRNGTLLSRGNDYTATTGTTVTLIDATLAGDIIEILANQLVPLTDAISKGQFTAKGTLLSATAASTPGVLAVGTNGQYLSADSTASTGLAWATASSGGMTSIASGSLSGTSLNLTSISATYNNFVLVMRGISTNADASLSVTVNGTASIYRQTAGEGAASGAGAWNIGTSDTFDSTVTNGFLQITAFDYANTSSVKTFQQTVSFKDTSAGGYWTGLTTISAQTSSAINQITVTVSGGSTFDAGTYTLYGVK